MARGLGYAGMYGIIFFLTQFLQDIQGHSALVTGLGFLPTPTIGVPVVPAHQQGAGQPAAGQGADGHRDGALRPRAALGHPARTAGASYPQVLASLVLIGAGMGVSFVSLTTAGLAGVAPSDAGAASGLINVMQQLGAALGLAVLVTVFDSVTSGAHAVGLSQVAGLGGRPVPRPGPRWCTGWT